MALVLGVIHRVNGVFGVSFPDYPGVAVGGASIEDALARSHDALLTHFEGLLEAGLDVPQPRNFVTFDNDEGLVGAHYVDVPIPAKALRINISMDEDLLGKVDRAAKAAGETRSAFLARAARERLAG
jgi:predicted RNase H-like HicB family nuclease